MKMVMIAYNEAVDLEVMEILQRCKMKNYTKIPGVFGKGTVSGTHLGTDVWPGRNNVLYVACDQEDSRTLFDGVVYLRKQLGLHGIKAFVWNVEAAT